LQKGDLVTDPLNELAELRALQQDAAEKRAQRKSARRKSKPVSDASPTTGGERANGAPAARQQSTEEPAPEWEKTLEDLAVHLESAVSDIEDVTREHPALALLAAFTIGVIAGQIFSRRASLFTISVIKVVTPSNSSGSGNPRGTVASGTAPFG
jgi:hypothetical protein